MIFVVLLGAGLPVRGMAVQPGDHAPKPIRREAPDFPPGLIPLHQGGTAMILCVVDETGRVTDAAIVAASHSAFGEAARIASMQWLFEPGTRDGKPAVYRVKIPFVFNEGFQQQLEDTFHRPLFVKLDGPVVTAESLPEWPQPIQQAWPNYPTDLKGTGKKGSTIISFIIDHDGQVVNPEIVKSSLSDFEAPSILAVLNLQYAPVENDRGEPLYVSMLVSYDFDEAMLKEQEKERQRHVYEHRSSPNRATYKPVR